MFGHNAKQTLEVVLEYEVGGDWMQNYLELHW